MGSKILFSINASSFLFMGILCFIFSVSDKFDTFWQVGTFRSLAVGCTTFGVKCIAETWNIEKINISEKTLHIIFLLCVSNLGFSPILDVIIRKNTEDGFVLFSITFLIVSVFSFCKLIMYLIHWKKRGNNNKEQNKTNNEIIPK